MQHIPDNEFDRLFKDRLMDAEVQPTADLWDRIAPQIAPKKKRSLSLYWSAAATVLVALSAGLLFKPQEKIALHAPVVQSELKVQGNEGDVPFTSAPVQTDSAQPSQDVEVGAYEPTAQEAEIDYVPNTQEAEKSLVAVQPIDEDSHHNITAAEEPAPVTPTKVETAISGTALANNTSPAIVEPEVTAITETAEVEQQSRPRIRNAGDLVNFVVDKLDKREQKFVEFRTDDDEGTSLVAINIGPLRINQRKHR